MDQPYTIKELAEATGVSVYTLRYYEQIGLIDPVARAVNGHRRYAETDRARVDFLKLLKATGMPISQMVRYVELYRQGESTFAERGALLEAHRRAMQAQMATLARTMELVEAKIARYFQSEDALVAG